ncbi:scavenger receptor class F member 1-like isoform X1 [Ostrea edulis]|uniref:scavenger receptor class F member 1-like isoform X1 n=2 Tax=Ostrea edulis TaxID=37623 RepID=UPI0020961AAD|nr:scavenger receptor class F member 1-like isoform X1 [Ostrea edulis]XP_056013742.1 scavenger receptor class F member 1-like isoform X1 [Ostrea edulis]XP_056013743.1 scavenger receptor class F member 1-like isoform X1 [Ostrea edulis]XP_056013744.1 scavenger receptor class F member 1-like isoform X1 [Ostrea edulis]
MSIWIAVFACTLLPLTVTDKSTCSKDNCKVWDTRMEKCSECDVGFQGECCQLSCRYPNYGDRCQSWCNCEITNCSFVTGCDDGSPTVSPGFPNASTTSLSALSIYTTSRACPPGYIGSDCKLPCRYPGYGDSCQSQCGCAEDLCHHMNGCKPYRYCGASESHRKDALLYTTIILGVVAVIQFTAYIYVSFFCKVGVLMVING